MKNIAIRADGGPGVGMGHIIRCLSLAKQLLQAGFHVFFISKLDDGINKIRSQGFEVVRIGEGLSIEDEAGKIVEILQELENSILVVDTYNVTPGYFLSIKPHLKRLVYIDDINSFKYPVDMLVNGNITGTYMHYEKYYEHEIMLLGTEYNLIRDEFYNFPARTINKKAEEIMITTGGSDPYNLSYKIAEMLIQEKEEKLKINLIVGSAYNKKEQLRKISETHKNIVLYENVKRMSEVMLRSDIAISSGGSTLYELCACGTPTLAFIMADNQEFLVNKMSELKFVESLGWYNCISNNSLVSTVKSMINDYEKRKAYSEIMQKLIDGKGSQRVVDAITNMQ